MLITRQGLSPGRRGAILARCDGRMRWAPRGRPPAVLLGVVLSGLALVSWTPTATAREAPTCFGRPATIVGHGAIRGTAHADVIVASRGADTIIGGGGNDRICAAGGDDTIEGGDGSDRIEAGSGDDEIIGGNGSDLVLSGGGADTVFGKRGNDRLHGGPGSDYVDSGLGDDTVDGGPGNGDQVIGGVGNDHVSGGPGDGDVLEGDYGTDTIDGGPGADDTASYAMAGSGATASGTSNGVDVNLATGSSDGDGNDTLSGIEDVVGSPFADTILGDVEPNQLFGGGGIDELLGGGGGDQAFGGSGLDRCLEVDFAESCEMSGGRAPDALLEAIAITYAEPQAFRPTLEVDVAGRSGALTAVVEWGIHLEGEAGIQMHVSFAEGAWIVDEQGVPIAAGEGCSLASPEIARCPIATVPTGLFLNGSGGADTIFVDPSVPPTASATTVGGLGIDELVGGAGDDSIDADAGGFPGDVVRGGPGDDALTGATVVDGDSGSDLLIAVPCGETIDGGPGIDSVSFARMEQGVEATLGGTAGFAPGPHLVGGCGSGPVRPAPTQITGSVESIEGSAFDDILEGDAGPNNILGRGGNDKIHGAGGNDFLVGGLGIDSIYGDGGADRLYARDGGSDRAIDCGSDIPGDVAFTDPFDPPARNCAMPRDSRSGPNIQKNSNKR
jgi:Ca2+-binding RTX toxin-like protein